MWHLFLCARSLPVCSTSAATRASRLKDTRGGNSRSGAAPPSITLAPIDRYEADDVIPGVHVTGNGSPRIVNSRPSKSVSATKRVSRSPQTGGRFTTATTPGRNGGSTAAVTPGSAGRGIAVGAAPASQAALLSYYKAGASGALPPATAVGSAPYDAVTPERVPRGTPSGTGSAGGSGRRGGSASGSASGAGARASSSHGVRSSGSGSGNASGTGPGRRSPRPGGVGTPNLAATHFGDGPGSGHLVAGFPGLAPTDVSDRPSTLQFSTAADVGRKKRGTPTGQTSSSPRSPRRL